MRLAKGETEEGYRGLFADHRFRDFLKDNKARLVLNPQVLRRTIKELTGQEQRRNWAAIVSNLPDRGLVPVTLGTIGNVVGLGIDERVGDNAVNVLPITTDEAEPSGSDLVLVLGKLGALQSLWAENNQPNDGSMAEQEVAKIGNELSLSSESWGRAIEMREVDVDGVKGRVWRFVDGERECALSMRQVLRYGKRVKAVTRSRRDRVVAGIFVPDSNMSQLKQQGELERAERLIAQPNNPQELAIVNEEQFALWNKYGYFGEFAAYREGAVPLSKVMAILRTQLPKGIDMQVQHASNGKIDIVLVPGQRRFPGEVVNIAVLGIENEKPKWVERVAGVSCVESKLSDRERKELASLLRGGLRLVRYGKNSGNLPNVLTVNSELLRMWKSEIKAGRRIIQLPETRPQIEVGQGKEKSQSIREVSFQTFERTVGIGSRFMQIVVEYGDGEEERVILDMGAQFDDFPWDGISKPSWQLGISPFAGHLPYVPRFVRRGLLVNEATTRGVAFLEDVKNPYLHDLWEWLGEARFVKLVSELAPELDASEISTYLAALPSMKHVHNIGVVMSHVHADHMGWDGLPTSRIPWLFSDESWPFLQTIFKAGSGWLSEGPLRRKRATYLSDAKLETYSPPILNPTPYEEVRIGRGRIGITMLPVPHSIYGAVSFVVRTFDEKDQPVSSIAYTGDFNLDNPELYEAAIQKMIELGVDTIVTDTTNLVESNKPSVMVTKDMMRGAFDEVIHRGNRGGVTAVGVSWNNIGDLGLIIEAAQRAGRQVLIPPKHAATLHFFAELDHGRTQEEVMFWRRHNPVPRLGSDAIPYLPIKASQTNAEKLLKLLYEVSIPRELGRNKLGDAVVVVPPNPHLYATLAGIDPRIIREIIWSHYWPYSSTDKMLFRTNQRFASENRIRWYGDYGLYRGQIYPAQKPTWHRSGHAKKDELLEVLRRLRNEGSLNKVIPVHGPSRGNAAEIIEAEFGRDLEVVSRVAKRRMDKIVLWKNGN